MLGSSVPPDLLETIKSVLARSTLFSTLLICAGSVESRTCRRGKPGVCGEGQSKHLRAKAGSAHAEQQNVRESAALNFVGERLQFAGGGKLLVDDIEPA